VRGGTLLSAGHLDLCRLLRPSSSCQPSLLLDINKQLVGLDIPQPDALGDGDLNTILMQPTLKDA
jgi:hypothetical protein